MNEFREAAEPWFAVAERDADAAAVLLEGDGATLFAALFHLQQLLEKTMKAMLVLEGIDPPKTHDLERLRELLPESRQLPSGLPPLRTIADWQVMFRYPEVDLPDDSIPAVEEASRVLQEMVELLNRLR